MIDRPQLDGIRIESVTATGTRIPFPEGQSVQPSNVITRCESGFFGSFRKPHRPIGNTIPI